MVADIVPPKQKYKLQKVLHAVSTMVLLHCTLISLPALANSNKLSFPKDRSIGKVYQVISKRVSNSRKKNRYIGEARGDLQLKKTVRLKVKLSYGALGKLQCLKKLANTPIVAIDCSKLPVKEADIENIAALNNLEWLNCEASDFNTACSKKITGLKKVTELNLSKTQIDKNAIPEISKLKSLRILHIGYVNHLKTDFRPLKKLTNLNELSLKRSMLRNQQLAPISTLEELRDLRLANNKSISDRALPYLLKLQNLQKLDLTDTSVSQMGLKKLAAIKSLRVLKIGIDSMKPREFAQLKAALRGITIVDGWQTRNLKPGLFWQPINH